MAVSTYDAAAVVVTMGGINLDGFGDGDFLSIEKADDDYTSRSGADGLVTRSKTNDKRADVTFTCEQSSTANDKLNAIRLTGLAAGFAVPMTILDLNGTTLLAGAASWIKKPPTQTFGKESGTREWALEVVLDVENYGGVLI